MNLETQVKLLIAENKKLNERIKNLEAHIIKQDLLISQQSVRIAELEELLHKSKLHKDSSNSSKPPSSDMGRPKRNQSLREKSNRPSGGQKGHLGTTLKQTDKPDEIIRLESNFCSCCGISLEGVESNLASKRQVIDIPPITPIVSEYQVYTKECPHCHKENKASYPDEVTNHVQYGKSIQSLIVYYSIYQYLPYNRMQKLFKAVYGLDISQGYIDNVLQRMSNKATSLYERIKSAILQSPQIGADETSVKVLGKKNWIWVWQNESYTYLSSSESRGSITIERLFPEGFAHSILNTDRWAAQLKTKTKGKQLCTAHLLRDLKYIQDLEKSEWASQFKSLIKESLDLKHEISSYKQDDPKVMQLESLLEILLTEEIPKSQYPETNRLQKSLKKHRHKILTHLYYDEVPPDNNGSERAIRNVKVKQKVSGQFKTGLDAFCKLRSVIDTCIKRGVDIMYALNNIVKIAATT